MEPATARCVAGTLRRATRSITRVYDRHLATAGLTTTQFSILRAIDRHDAPVALSTLADEQVFERTSLYRALEPLERDGFVAMRASTGRAKYVELTTLGRRRVELATPRWNAAQEEFVSRFGRSAWSTLSSQLIDIVEIARAMPTDDH